MKFISVSAVALLVSYAPAFTQAADTYPAKPLRLIAPYPPGGASDIIARFLGGKLADVWGQQTVVDNRAGANGGIGCELAAKSPADGYTLLIGNMTPIAANPSLYRKLGYDSLRDFAGISLVAVGPNILVVNTNVPVKSVKELIALAKAKPGDINYASGPVGSANYLAAELFKYMAGVNLVRISYKGGGPAVNDLLAGQVKVMFATTGSVTQHVKSGRMRALAATSAEPTALAPGLPTIAAAVPGYESLAFYGLFVPLKTPPAIIARLNEASRKYLELPDTKERFFNSGVEAVGSTPQAFDAEVKADTARMQKMIQAAGLRVE